MKNKIKLITIFGMFALYVVAIKTIFNSNYLGTIIAWLGMLFLSIVLVWVLDGLDEEEEVYLC